MIDPKTDTLWRTYLVYFLVLIFAIAIIAKIIVVQTRDNKELVKLAEQREYRVDTLEASRGNIFSADGQLMATTIPLYDVFFACFSRHYRNSYLHLFWSVLSACLGSLISALA